MTILTYNLSLFKFLGEGLPDFTVSKVQESFKDIFFHFILLRLVGWPGSSIQFKIALPA